ncbi:MAG: hypothetical protein GXP32_10435, partial [Kiritimatiellaeota bacterium]|nr:hypothetical protein [Kiritimatiellota bacterium]
RRLNDRAGEAFKLLAEDFPIYEMEERQKKVCAELFNKTRSLVRSLARINPEMTNDGILNILEKERALLASSAKPLDRVSRIFTDMDSFSKVMRHAGEFMKFLNEQKSIVQRLSRFKVDPGGAGSPVLARMGMREKVLRAGMVKLKKKLAESAEALPRSFDRFKRDTLLFLTKMDDRGIIFHLKRASDNAMAANGDSACKYAELALENMIMLLDSEIKKNNVFAKLCRGDISSGLCGGGIPGDCMGSASQMLRSILRRCRGANGMGTETSAGGGTGNLDDGYSMKGSSMLNTPVFGPKRSSFGANTSSRHSLSRSTKHGVGVGAGKSVSRDMTERIKLDVQKEVETEGVQLDEVPGKYRDAVKKYFSE